jgi:hypothetical protein
VTVGGKLPDVGSVQTPAASTWSHALRGAFAGAVGSLAEGGWSWFEVRRLGGRPPVFDAQVMAARLLARLTGHIPSRKLAAASGRAMRVSYALALGAGWSASIGRRWSDVRAALLLAAWIWVGELLALPATGATPPLRTWPRAHIALDASNCLVFAVVVTVLLGKAPGETGQSAAGRGGGP